MHQIIYNLPPSVEQAFVYLLIGKACHCIDVRVSHTHSVSLTFSVLSLSFSHTETEFKVEVNAKSLVKI